MIDLRSDTVTRPTPEMRQVMAGAEVGDDVFREDPVVNRFERKVAARFGMADGLFVPSGTMGNQLALNLLTDPCDEVLIEETAHVFNFEGAAAGLLSGIQLRTLPGQNGLLEASQLEQALRPHNDWDPRISVVSLENSANKGGGTCYTADTLKQVREKCDHYGWYLHLDGARIWNAALYSELDLSFYGQLSDTMSVCFSKGLGAPVGSMLLGSEELVRRGRRMRKIMGGGMRQAGLLAAAADHALEQHYPLLEEDHRRARELAQVLGELNSFRIDPQMVQTNILLFDVVKGSVDETLDILEQDGIGMVPFGPQTIRAVFHFEIGDEELKHVMSVFRNRFD